MKQETKIERNNALQTYKKQSISTVILKTTRFSTIPNALFAPFRCVVDQNIRILTAFAPLIAPCMAFPPRQAILWRRRHAETANHSIKASAQCPIPRKTPTNPLRFCRPPVCRAWTTCFVASSVATTSSGRCNRWRNTRHWSAVMHMRRSHRSAVSSISALPITVR